MHKILIFTLSLIISHTIYADIDEIRKRGELLCGVYDDRVGFSAINQNGDFEGLNTDMCRAIAVSIFNDKNKVKFITTYVDNRFTKLTNQEIDVLVANATWTMSRDVNYGEYVGVYYYDGQGFLTNQSSNIKNARDLVNSHICVLSTSTSEKNILNFLKNYENSKNNLVTFRTADGIISAYKSDKCSVITGDISMLLSLRTELNSPTEQVILPFTISKEPLGIMVAHNQEILEDIARWSISCMINAEEYGINSNNVKNIDSLPNPSDVKRLLGQKTDISKLGLDKNWCINIISKVGNYAEVFDRNLGVNTSIGLSRGINKVWTDGGLLFAPQLH